MNDLTLTEPLLSKHTIQIDPKEQTMEPTEDKSTSSGKRMRRGVMGQRVIAVMQNITTPLTDREIHELMADAYGMEDTELDRGRTVNSVSRLVGQGIMVMCGKKICEHSNIRVRTTMLAEYADDENDELKSDPPPPPKSKLLPNDPETMTIPRSEWEQLIKERDALKLIASNDTTMTGAYAASILSKGAHA